MDTPTALRANEAPFLEGTPVPGGDPQFINTVTGVTKQEFKLFAKKTFTNNLLTINDYNGNAGMQNAQALRLQWTIDFRSTGDA